MGNTEILTEFSDVLAFTTAYTYKGDAAGYTVQTGTSSGTPVSTSLQLRLDDTVSVKAFGATGDGVTDDTAAINAAIADLFYATTDLDDNDIPKHVTLYFPAGVYFLLTQVGSLLGVLLIFLPFTPMCLLASCTIASSAGV